MLNNFKTYYQQNKLFENSDTILLAVSGGIDSVVMVDMFSKSQLKFGIVHCNFKLRGNDSNLDEQFVRKLANSYKVPFYSKSFNTDEYAAKKNISIQMAARELRYEWFEKIRKDENYDYIATAHHKNDLAETMIINLAKGTGIAGLHGILAKKKKIVRPLLFFSRKEIVNYLSINKLKYREDISNSNTDYVRNKIRHKIIPELEKINPNIIETLYTESGYFLESEEILMQKIALERERCFFSDGDLIKIDIKKLLELHPLKTYLFYFLKDCNFNISDIKDIISGLSENSGKEYYSPTHLIIKDRDFLILKRKELKLEMEYFIDSLQDFEKLPFSIKADIIEKDTDFKIDSSVNLAYIDIDLITFPMTIRKKKNGDVFQPYGMKGKKKVSDFFIDKKLSIIDKENTWILLSNEKIVWVIGHRIDERYKITNPTKKVLRLKKDV